MTCIKHPMNRLKLTTVDVGEKEFIQIVWAPNVDLGQKVLVSVGTILHKGNESFKIKKENRGRFQWV